MSNRKIEQASALAELRVTHEAQIEALTAPGLTDEERVLRFAEAAGFSYAQTDVALKYAVKNPVVLAVWFIGGAQRSLFASFDMGPTYCECPVAQNEDTGGRAFPNLPSRASDLRADRAMLEEFARVQQEARFPGG